MPDANPYPALRQRILNAKVRMEKLPTKPLAFAGMFEMGVENGVATLVVIADGTTSLYDSNGGGIIGAGQREQVKKPSTLFPGMLSRHPVEMGPDPTAGACSREAPRRTSRKSGTHSGRHFTPATW